MTWGGWRRKRRERAAAEERAARMFDEWAWLRARGFDLNQLCGLLSLRACVRRGIVHEQGRADHGARAGSGG